ncbi:MAG: 23S rRNA (guanosine(2251)-2'-O)-methyltransferase RlmB [Holosporaceae bacterium]|jgi:23S rRNA (guanosine2251-2'-O)-methyltransferase|nr:23S rRNA (guanosine(2251)-2'-O)-methyltransferase RlmB [Holosporaceae bacterium]
MKKKIKNFIWIYGRHALKAALLNPAREIIRVVALESCKNFLEECRNINQSIKYEIVDKTFFVATFGNDATHQGCAAYLKNLPEYSLEELLEDASDNHPFIFLDQVTDPQNVGSILRASAVFGARAVVMTENGSPELSPTMAKAASGALETVPLVRVVNFAHSINFLKKHGFWCLGLEEKSEKNISDIPLNDKFIFVIGSEGDGMRRLTRESCDFLVKLPGSGQFTTLNAAQAATVALYESFRVRSITRSI